MRQDRYSGPILRWEVIGGRSYGANRNQMGPTIMRAAVPAGWLVCKRGQGAIEDHGDVIFFQDPEHSWKLEQENT